MTAVGRTVRRGRSSPSAATVLLGRAGNAAEHAVTAIENMALDQLRAEWQRRFNRAAPRCRSKEVIRGLLVWRIQAEANGGLSADTARRLRRIADDVGGKNRERQGARVTRTLKPGTVLTREWRGVLHKVHVLESGFAHNGRTFSSLSDIARSITGTHWSGPRFFGLRDKGACRGPADEVRP